MAKLICSVAAVVCCLVCSDSPADKPAAPVRAKRPGVAGEGANAAALKEIARLQVGNRDWPQWGGSSGRNNTPAGKNIPVTWDVTKGTNIKWRMILGSQSYTSPVVANGRGFVGTNNAAGYVRRFPPNIDLGCLLCFDEQTGRFLWQYSILPGPPGRGAPWPMAGVCSTPYVHADRLWFVSPRGEVVCLDVEGFHDNENDGPVKNEDNENKDEADVVWTFDMPKVLGVSPHDIASCSVTCVGRTLLVGTSNGVGPNHVRVTAPNAPSFIALDRDTGELLWSDNSPGGNILHGQWSSPTVVVVNGKPQALFAGGDGWLRGFDPNGNGKGGSRLLWKFDCNPKDSVWRPGGSGTRNNLIATPVVYDGLIYLAVGQDPQHGEGMGHLYCIKPPKARDGRDVSPFLALNANGRIVPPRRVQAIDSKRGEKAVPNPQSAMVWHYGSWTTKEYANKPFEKQMHRTCGNATIKNGILVISDFSGIVHCLDARSGKAHWTFDLNSETWGTPLIVDGKIFVGDVAGDVSVFPLNGDRKQALRIVNGERVPAMGKVAMRFPVYSTPVVANDVLYIVVKNALYAISAGGK